MPQMYPMYWLFMYFTTLITLFLFINLNYFFLKINMQKKNMFLTPKNKNSINLKW